MNDSKQTKGKRLQLNVSADKAIGIWAIALLLYPIIAIWAIRLLGKYFGYTTQILGGVCLLFGFFLYLKWLYGWLDRIGDQSRVEKREKYRSIYKIKALPVSEWAWARENIKIGDYAWQMEPWNDWNSKCDLVYLHALDEQWGVVWIAGFRQDDVEVIGSKPVSEYDWRDFEYDGPKPKAPYHWGLAKVKSLCPFPVNTRDRKISPKTFPV